MKSSPRNLGLVYVISLITAGVIGGVVALSSPNWISRLPASLQRIFISSTDTKSNIINGTRVVTTEESAVINVVSKASEAVVSVVAKTTNFDPFTGPTTSQQGIGTGFIIDKNGTILTNSHVVADPSIQYTVVTKDKKSLSVKKIETDPLNDLAILTVEGGGNLPTIVLGDSDGLKIGQTVIAIGNALGRFDNTVTVGVISGKGRGITASDSLGQQPETIDNVLQTDAALNPGNSGGPLLDLDGQVVGVNFATTTGAQNLGFVIPINTAKPVIEGFRSQGRIVKPYLGVGYQVIDESIASLRNLPQGAFVSRVVSGSPADKGGIEVGDIITKIGDQALDSDHTLATEIGKHKVGEGISISYHRDSADKKTNVTLEEAPASLNQR